MQPFIDILPFIGQVDADNVTYRQRLLEISMSLIAQSPWLGVPGYMNYMEELRQGQGIIDIVNSYVGIALNTGVIGLGLFCGVFVTMLWPLWRLRRRAEETPEGARIAVTLMATTLALLFVIVTTSSIVVIPHLLHMLAGLGVTCARLYTARPSPAAPAAWRPGGDNGGLPPFRAAAGASLSRPPHHVRDHAPDLPSPVRRP
jgi:O-antigen ligase